MQQITGWVGGVGGVGGGGGSSRMVRIWDCWHVRGACATAQHSATQHTAAQHSTAQHAHFTYGRRRGRQAAGWLAGLARQHPTHTGGSLTMVPGARVGLSVSSELLISKAWTEVWNCRQAAGSEEGRHGSGKRRTLGDWSSASSPVHMRSTPTLSPASTHKGAPWLRWRTGSLHPLPRKRCMCWACSRAHLQAGAGKH
jgi:hypothetical protein